MTDDDYTTRMSAFVRLAADPANPGVGPSGATIQNYVNQGLMPHKRDSTGRLLFRASDAPLALKIYYARRARHGHVGVRGFQPVKGAWPTQSIPSESSPVATSAKA